MRLALVCSAALAVFAAACAQPAPVAQAPTREQVLERGAYIVAISGCNDCHTPMTPNGPDMSRSLHGADLTFAPMNPQPWAPHAPQLAGLPEGYTEAQLAQFLVTGARAEASAPTLPPMPRYRMHEDDAAAAAAYIASLSKPPA